MTLVLGFFFFALGTIIGSFLSVVVWRYGSETLGGRSHCQSCGKDLTWHQLIPILSFVFQKGRCATCCVRIPVQDFLFEIITGLLFLGAFLIHRDLFYVSVYGFAIEIAFVLVSMGLLLAIAGYDLRHKIIPNWWSYSFAFVALLYLFFDGETASIAMPAIWDLLAGPLFFTPFFLLWFISGGKWIGLGDAKLAVGIGWFLGLVGGISALLLAFWIGAAVGLLVVGFNKIRGKLRLFGGLKGLTMKSEIPFAPFMVLGLLLVYFFNINVLPF